MYKNILVPVLVHYEEDSARSIEIAKHLLGTDGQMLLLHVIEELPNFIANQLPNNVMSDNVHNAQSQLEALAKLAGSQMQPHVAVGHPSRTILEYADKHASDLIIIASHQPGLEDYFLGSTASRIVRRAQCAVHILR